MNRLKLIRNVGIALIVLMGVLTVGTTVVHAQGGQGGSVTGSIEFDADLSAPSAEPGYEDDGVSGAAPYYAIALVMGFACLSAGYAVGKVGAAALGAAAENPDLLGKAIIFVGLGEGIAVFGLIISMMLIGKL